MSEVEITTIMATIFLFPVYMIFMSMAWQIGKIFAIRLLFKRSDSIGKEER
jgi:hypothetical protein